MTDLEGVIDSVVFQHPLDPRPAARHIERLGDGVFHMDYDDPGHVYLVTVRQVPRVRLPLQRPVVVGEVNGVRLELVNVALANHIEITLDAEQGPAREAALAEFMARYRQWQQGGGTETPPPLWPAEALPGLHPAVSDDVGTPYRFASGQAGGEGKEWEAASSFLPTPPAEARLLTLRFSPPLGEPVQIDLPLPPT